MKISAVSLVVLIWSLYPFLSSSLSHHLSQPRSSSQSLNPLRRYASESPDYTCGPNKPCENKACCGKEGICGQATLR
ncbi:hypothetical protein M432DRAFT_615210 [Thermoascus aurantiacus ATCC 26904]